MHKIKYRLYKNRIHRSRAKFNGRLSPMATTAIGTITAAALAAEIMKITTTTTTITTITAVKTTTTIKAAKTKTATVTKTIYHCHS